MGEKKLILRKTQRPNHLRHFDDLQKSSVELSEEDVKQLLKVAKDQTMLRRTSPFKAYAYLIKLYLDMHAGEVSKSLWRFMEEKGYRPFTYQLESVSQEIADIKAHGGTMIADVVTL